MHEAGGRDGSKGKQRWPVWAGLLILTTGMVMTRPARAEGSEKKPPAAPSAERLKTDLAQLKTELAQTLTAVLEQASRLREQGNLEDAIQLLQRILPIAEEALGPDDSYVANLLCDLATMYQDKEDYVRAEPLLLRALAIYEKKTHRIAVAKPLRLLGSLYVHKADYARAEPLLQRALAILEATYVPDHPLPLQEVALTLLDLGDLYRARADFVRAEPLLLRAVAIFEKAPGPDGSDLAVSLSSLARFYLKQGDYARAEPLFQRVVLIFEEASGPDSLPTAIARGQLATLYAAKADYARAEPLLLHAVAVLEKTLGPDHPSVAYHLQTLAGIHARRGDIARAEALLLRVVAALEKTLGPDHTDVAYPLGTLSELYVTRGDVARAKSLLLRAVAIFEKALGPDHPDVAPALVALADTYLMMKDYARGEPLLLRALSILEKAFGPDHANVAQTLASLAILHVARGELARAEALLLRGLAIQTKALGRDHTAVANTLVNLAGLHMKTKAPARAEPLLLRALAIYEKAYGPVNSPKVADVLDYLAWTYLLQGRAADAMTSASRALGIHDHNAISILTTGSESQKRLYMGRLEPESGLVVSLHVQGSPGNPDAARLALTVLLRRKGRVLDTMTDSLAALRRSAAPDHRELLDRLASVYAQLATQVSRLPGELPPDQYRRNLAALEKERESLEGEVSRRSAVFRAEQRVLTLADVQAAVPPGAALVEIARYAPFAKFSGKGRYVAYVLHPKGEPTFADLGEADAIDAAADKLRLALADHDRTHDPRPAARALDELLVAPIRKLLGDTRWVFLSPDGPLHLIPFGALVDEDNHYLVERYLFSYLTTGRDLLRFGNERPVPPEAPLVLANPSFDDSSAPPLPDATHRGLRSIDMVTQRLPPLESTAEEARTIAQMFPDSRVLLGPKATEEAVKTAHAPRLLHLATHGFFLPKQPLPEALLHRGPGGDPTPAERLALLQRENPLLRSGVALAGFNRRQSGSDDGVLTALEVAGLDLYGTRLVVLSTCESGVGEASSGEGVYGLRRALVMAGAETQVMSLWQVDTGRTRELMQAYYEKLRDGGGRSEAMREVQLAMLATPATAHPNLWASFIVSGEWRTLEGKARLPDVGKVSPGLRGCSCQQAGSGQTEAGAWLMLVLVLAAMGRRRSTDARVRRGGGVLR